MLRTLHKNEVCVCACVRVCVCVCVCVPGWLHPWPSKVRPAVRACVFCCFCDRTLGAATYPSVMMAMSVRRHTKVLAIGEG